MLQWKLRSGVYRSFIMCDDPRGVVEAGAIKKQNKPPSTKTKEMARRKSTEEAPSSLQLLRVSKGIQKLNVAIDSWSKSVRPEDIAKDLLRGALDLEESLAMLTSIQENEKKPRSSSKDGGRSDLRFQRSMSDRFGERIEKRMMNRQENHVESKDCYEELRKVIRESFVRQSLLPQARTNTRVVRNDFASSSGAASSSTSSSQSSMVSGSTKSSASSDIPRKGPSLIARLMGLDVSSPQEPNKSTVIHIDKPDIVKKNVRCNNSTSEAVVEEAPSENPSTIVLIRPKRVVQPEMEEKPGNKRPVLPRKPRMQGEVYPRVINQRKDHQASSNKMKLPQSLTKKDREPKETVRKVEENEGKVIKITSTSNAKPVTRERKPMEANKKVSVKKESTEEGKDRYRAHDRTLKPPNSPATQKKASNPSDMSRNKIRRSRLSSSSSSDEQKSNTRLKKSGEASKPKAKKKLHQQGNDLASENNSASSQDTRGSLNQLSAEETTSSELHIQDDCDNGEVTSCAATIQHSHEQETSQIFLKSFLSSSQDFISYAENLFDVNTNTKRSQESSTFQNKDSIVVSDQRLALDFAKEVAKRKSLLLITEPTCSRRSSVDIDELLTEICDGFESLRSYRDTFLIENSFVKESIDMVLEKDLNSKKTEMSSGVWELGWRSEFQIDETHQTVADLEKLILSGLIQEILS